MLCSSRLSIGKTQKFFFCILLFFAELAYANPSKYEYIEKLPIYVTDVAEEDKLELYVKVPDGFCHNSLVKRVSGDFHKKEYIPCADLKTRKAEKIFYVFYNKGKFQASAEKIINESAAKLSEFCSSHRIYNYQNKQFGNYTQSSLIASCFDMKTTKKSVMLFIYFAGEKDCSALHYVVRVPMEYPEDLALNEIMQYVNSDYFAILKNNDLDSRITLEVDHKAK